MMRISVARLQRSVPLAFVAALVLACALVFSFSGPARAFPITASFTASDYQWAVTGGSGTTVHIDPGGTVDFAYPSGLSSHNADFGATAPTSCSQSSGTNSGAVPPLPATPTSAGWSGTCTFNTTGTYTFRCDLHTSMKGTVFVGDVPEPTPPTGGNTPGGSGSGGTQNGGGAVDPLAGLKIAKAQRGTKVNGSIADVVAGSAVTIEVTARASALKTSAKVRVARFSKSGLNAGTLKFSIKVNKKARGATEKNGKLALSATVRITPPGASVAKATRSVSLARTRPIR